MKRIPGWRLWNFEAALVQLRVRVLRILHLEGNHILRRVELYAQNPAVASKVIHLMEVVALLICVREGVPMGVYQIATVPYPPAAIEGKVVLCYDSFESDT